MVHLILLIHGYFGRPSDMEALRKALERKCSHDPGTRIHVATSHEFLKTMDGIKTGGERMYRELMSICDNEVQRISFVGYSLGGLIARNLIGILEAQDFWNSTNIERGFYASIATPHLGAARMREGMDQTAVNFFARCLLGVSGREMWATGSRGIVSEMADPEKHYYKALQKFPRLILFANGTQDRTVKFWTSFITTKEPFDDLDKTELTFFRNNYGSLPPCVLDIENSRHIEAHAVAAADEEEPSKKFSPPKMMLTVMFIPAVVMSIRSSLRQIYMWYYWRKEFAKALERQKQISNKQPMAIDYNSSSDALPGERTISGALQTGLDAPVQRRGSDVHHMTEEQSNPHPLRGSCEFLDGSPVELTLTLAKRKQIDALNRLPWEKYCIVFEDETWSHASIVNRHNRKHDQGHELGLFIADTLYSIYSS